MNEALTTAAGETHQGDDEWMPGPPAPRVVTYLHYTDVSGQCITFGVDENSLLVMVMKLCPGERPNFSEPRSLIVE